MKIEQLESIYKECIQYSNMIKNPILKEVVQKIYQDYKNDIMSKPASPGSHHYFKG